MTPDRTRIYALISLVLIFPACSIKIGPNPLQISPAFKERPPVLRVGEITESLTGSWTQDPGIGSSAIRNYLVETFKEPSMASRFSPESSNLTMNVDLVSDHESDLPRLNSLGSLSLATLGIIPLSYFSEWNVDCKVRVVAQNGVEVADYIFQERGTYRILAFPLTMLTLSGAGLRGDNDARAVYQKVAAGLSAKIAEALDKDYEKFAARVKKLDVPRDNAVDHPAQTSQPLIV